MPFIFYYKLISGSTHFADGPEVVPLIVVFTKHDQFKLRERDDCADCNWETEAQTEAERVFQEQHLGKFGSEGG
jgi:hypothetical protein